MTSSVAWRLVSNPCPYSRSTFNDPNSVSLQALTLPAIAPADHRARDAVLDQHFPEVLAGLSAPI